MAGTTTTTTTTNNNHQTSNDLLNTQPLLILDGGLGTTLELPPYNVRFSAQETPLWSSHLLISDPATLRDIHTRFVAEGGAQVVLTGSYQASFEGFALTPRPSGGGGVAADRTAKAEAKRENGGGFGEEAAKGFMRKSVTLARDAFVAVAAREENTGNDRAHRQQRQRQQRHERGLVALSLGAYGATLIPGAEYSGAYGDGPREGLEGWHARRLEVFSGHQETWDGVDVVAFETLPRLDEVRAVRSVMTALDRGTIRQNTKPWWVCCVFPGKDDDDDSVSGYTLPDGSTVEKVVQAMLGGEGSQPWGIGLNCTKIWKVRSLITEFEHAVQAAGYEWPRLVLYPDGAGDLVYDSVTQEWKEKKKAHGQGVVEENKSWDQEMAEIVTEVQERGLWKGVVVGGCCKTGPEHIGALSQRLKV